MAMALEDEADVRAEVEAVLAVYGDDCSVVEEFPPHLALHIKPRTADDSSQQFVEATLGIQTGSKYPMSPPCVYIIDTNGLDENRKVLLLSGIEKKAHDLSSCPMLVALFEEAVEILSSMNHPEGDCPLCLYPLVAEDRSGSSLPFMKLMSCYHCFHSECFMRWWKWLQEENETNKANQAEATVPTSMRNRGDVHTAVDQQQGNCPVCRKKFVAKDLEHVLDYLGTNTSRLSLKMDLVDERRPLQSESENRRRQKLETLLKLQEENNGLIEARRELAIVPGMYLPAPAEQPSTSSHTHDVQPGEDAINSASGMDSDSSVNKAAKIKHNNSNTRRRNRFHSARRQPNVQPCRQRWTKKELDSSKQ